MSDQLITKQEFSFATPLDAGMDEALASARATCDAEGYDVVSVEPDVTYLLRVVVNRQKREGWVRPEVESGKSQ